MITVNGRCAGRKVGGGGIGERGKSVHSMGEKRKDFCPNVLQPFPENIDKRSCNDGSRELIPVFHNPHRKCRSYPSAPWGTFKQCDLRLRGAGGRKNKFGSTSKMPLNILKAVIRSARNLRRNME